MIEKILLIAIIWMIGVITGEFIFSRTKAVKTADNGDTEDDTRSCDTCKWCDLDWDEEPCDECFENEYSGWESNEREEIPVDEGVQ